MFRFPLVLIATAGLFVCVLCVSVSRSSQVAAASQDQPAYNKDGSLLPLGNYRDWVYLTSGIDMSYTEKPAGAKGRSMFDNVFVNPKSYRSFLASGTWPDRTIMVLEVRGARSKGSINQRGHYQGTGIMGLEVHVKDEAVCRKVGVL